MEWIINKQIAVTADTPEEAVQKISEGKTISLNVTVRPQAAQQTVRGPVGMFQQSSATPTPKLNG